MLHSYLYSKLSGFNIYDVDLDSVNVDVPFPVKDIRADVGNGYVASVINCHKIPLPLGKAAWFANMIRNPVQQDLFEWPLDVVEVDKDGSFYTCLVLKKNEYLGMKPIRELLYQPSMSEILDWRDPFILTVCKNIVSAMETLHSHGYIYNDFNIDNILYDPGTGKVLFKFNDSIRINGCRTKFDEVEREDISPEFAPPYIYDNDKYDRYLSFESDNYQLASILFRLMIGKLPYAGMDLMNYGVVIDPFFDVDENAHAHYFEHYHEYPHFIFDENDKTNSLSHTSASELPKERWKKLPDRVRQMFSGVLCQKTAEDLSAGHVPTAQEWLNALSKLGKDAGK